MDAMKQADTTCEFSGIGGHQMELNGLESLFPLEKMSVMGFVEVIKHLRFFKEVEKKVLETIFSEKPERIILIDYPGFNLRLAKKIKQKFNIPITYYISPQIWAWKEKRINIIREYINQVRNNLDKAIDLLDDEDKEDFSTYVIRKNIRNCEKDK